MNTFVQYRASGQIKDFLRREDPLTRTQRERVRSGMDDSPVRVDIDIDDVLSSDPSPEDQAILAEVYCWIHNLTLRDRFVIEALFFRELTAREVAGQLGLGTVQIRGILRTALRRLRKHLGMMGVS